MAAAEASRSPVIELTFEACELARAAISFAAEALASGSAEAVRRIRESEERLDEIDREVDQFVGNGVLEAAPSQVRELLASLKIVTDLERISDLAAALAAHMEEVRDRLDMPDRADLIRMATIVEKMLADFVKAYSTRDTECALGILRADVEVDRLRNLILLRRMDGVSDSSGSQGLQIVLMAQSLERAADHCKNLAEEVCHLTTGHSVRHLARSRQQPTEQLFLKHLRHELRNRMPEYT
jgi:phosphate transport system protein